MTKHRAGMPGPSGETVATGSHQTRTDDDAQVAVALATSEERLRLGLEAGRMVTWEFDLVTGALNQSSNSAAIFGSGAKPEDYTARMPTEDLAHDQDCLQRALASPDGLYQSEFRYRHPDGRLLHLQNWGKVKRNETGEPIRVHGVCMDITDRKQAEIALTLLNETLERNVEDRTRELLQTGQALRQSQKMEALGHLTGGVAHDFNNLLGALVGTFELIRRRSGDPARVRDLAETGLRVAERGAKLTGQLLSFSRTQQIELKVVEIAVLIEGMREILARTLGPLIALEFDVACQGQFVRSDPTQLEMAVLNLAINARDAMTAGGKLFVAARRSTIAADPALAAGDYVEILIQDTGSGMSGDVAARAFDPFFTTKGVGKGTGLGLSQVYGIARQTGGTVRIESRLGAGTTIRMLLPCTDAAPDAEPMAGDPAPEIAVVAGGTVLLVDDDDDLRAVITASLEDLGYRVLEAPDGAAALALLEQGAPDVLIADFAMPGMTGAELARTARRRNPALPIILASGHGDTTAMALAAGGGIRILRKPFRSEELKAVVAAALAQPRR